MGTQSSAFSQLILQVTSSSIIMKFLLCVPALLTIAAAGHPPPIPPTYAPPSPPPGYAPPPPPAYGHMPPQPHPFFQFMLMNLLKDSNNGGDGNNNFQRMMLLQHLFSGMGHSHGGPSNPLSHPLIMNSLLNQQCTEPVADCTIPNNNNGIPCGSSPTPQYNDVDIKPCCKCTSQ